MSVPDNFDWTERSCPLPVVRKHYDEDADHYNRAVEVCGSPLYVSYERSTSLLVGGECDTCGETWQVVCESGHTLYVPDHEADDRYHLLPFEQHLAGLALSAIECRFVEAAEAPAP